jgi:hypothetical protein
MPLSGHCSFIRQGCGRIFLSQKRRRHFLRDTCDINSAQTLRNSQPLWDHLKSECNKRRQTRTCLFLPLLSAVNKPTHTHYKLLFFRACDANKSNPRYKRGEKLRQLKIVINELHAARLYVITIKNCFVLFRSAMRNPCLVRQLSH